MSPLRTWDQGSCLADPGRRESYLVAMFDEIAPRYDRFTRWFSFGMDASWKAQLITAMRRGLPGGGPPGACAPVQAADLACGTGDIARALADAIPGLTVTAIDLSPRMLTQARPHPAVRFRVGDATRLDEPASSLHAVTVGYGLRNFPDHRAALAEIHRVLVPGGVLGILEFTRPSFALWRWILLGYLWLAGMIYGWCWHRHGPVYGYIAHSIARFTTRRELEADLAKVGFELLHRHAHLGGGMAVLVARKRT